MNLLQKHRELVLYLVFGVLTTLVNLGCYALLCAVFPDLPHSPLSLAATVISILFAYVTNRRWVFESRAQGRREVLREAVSFFSARALTLVLDLVVILVAVDLLGWPNFPVKTAVTVAVIALNYVFSKLWVFRK